MVFPILVLVPVVIFQLQLQQQNAGNQAFFGKRLGTAHKLIATSAICSRCSLALGGASAAQPSRPWPVGNIMNINEHLTQFAQVPTICTDRDACVIHRKCTLDIFQLMSFFIVLTDSVVSVAVAVNLNNTDGHPSRYKPGQTLTNSVDQTNAVNHYITLGVACQK